MGNHFRGIFIFQSALISVTVPVSCYAVVVIP